MFTKAYHLKNAEIDIYSRERSCGFVTEEDRQKDELLQLPELNTGFEVPYWYRGEHITEILSDGHGCYVDSEKIAERIDAERGRLIPLCYKADVPAAGNYEVQAELYGCGEILVFAGARRLVYRERLETAREIHVSFTLNVCPIIPRGKTCLYENYSVNIAVLGEQVRLSEITVKEVDCPTIYIAGDSTVTDQSAEYPYAAGTSYAGWGQMLPMYLKDGIAVSNHAHSGLTVESFRSEGHYAIVQAHMKPADYLLLQFGHNDQKLMHLKAKEGYRDGLMAYVDEALGRGAYPVIVTPLARNSWKADDGTYNDLLEEYAEECIKIGKECNIPVIDLHGKSMDMIVALGLEEAKRYYFPNDFTHTNDYGAYKMAGFIAGDYLDKYGVAAGGSPPCTAAAAGTDSCVGLPDAYTRLAGFLVKREAAWEADKAVELPTVPEKYKNIPNPEQGAALFDDVERPDEELTRVEALEFVIKAARFFPTNVFNDVYDDIVGHEWYAGTVQCAYQNGIILPEMISDRKFEPERKVTLEEFLVLMMGGYKSRKKLPEEKPCELDAQCAPYSVPFVRAAYALGVVFGTDKLKETITRGRAAQIGKALNI